MQFWDVHTTGVETLITEADVAEDGNAVTITCSGANAAPPTFAHRYYGWEYKHTPTDFPQPWKNWRADRPAANASIKIDTALTSRRALLPGYYMRWRTGVSYINSFMGQWKSSNAASGLSNIEATHGYWDWGAKFMNAERIRALLGMTFNASNPNYAANSGDPYWQDPNPGTTEIQWRYTTGSNVLDLYDFTNSAVIATKTVALGGTGIYLTFGFGASVTHAQMNDDFLGGGDVTFGTL